MDGQVPVQSFDMSAAEEFLLNESSENEQLVSSLQPTPVIEDKNDKARQSFFSSLFPCSPKRATSRCTLHESNRPITPCLNSFMRTVSPRAEVRSPGKKGDKLVKQVTMWRERNRIWIKQKQALEQQVETLLNVPISKAGEMRVKVYERKIEELQRQLSQAQDALQRSDPSLRHRLEKTLSECQSELIVTKGKVAERDIVVRKQNQLLKEREIRVRMMEAEINHMKQLRLEEDKLHTQGMSSLSQRCSSLEDTNARIASQMEDLHSQLLSKDRDLQAWQAKARQERDSSLLSQERTAILTSLKTDLE